MGPNDKAYSLADETVEVLEVIENCQDSYNVDDDSDIYITEDY